LRREYYGVLHEVVGVVVDVQVLNAQLHDGQLLLLQLNELQILEVDEQHFLWFRFIILN
jgi:hypothetical protein